MGSLTDEIMGKLKGKKAGGGDSAPAVEPDADEEGSYGGSDEEAAMQDFIDAVKAGDAAGAVEAHKAFMTICYPKLDSGPGHMEMGGEE